VKEGDFIDSSGFEHVFVGELKPKSIGGMHNWIQMYLQQEAGKLDVYGYFTYKKQNLAQFQPDANDRIMTLKFRWKGPEDEYRAKFGGSILLGTSPEFEMAIYTLSFFLADDNTQYTLDTGDDKFTYQMKSYGVTGSGSKIATIYASIKDKTL